MISGLSGFRHNFSCFVLLLSTSVNTHGCFILLKPQDIFSRIFLSTSNISQTKPFVSQINARATACHLDWGGRDQSCPPLKDNLDCIMLAFLPFTAQHIFDRFYNMVAAKPSIIRSRNPDTMQPDENQHTTRSSTSQ